MGEIWARREKGREKRREEKRKEGRRDDKDDEESTVAAVLKTGDDEDDGLGYCSLFGRFGSTVTVKKHDLSESPLSPLSESPH